MKFTKAVLAIALYGASNMLCEARGVKGTRTIEVPLEDVVETEENPVECEGKGCDDEDEDTCKLDPDNLVDEHHRFALCVTTNTPDGGKGGKGGSKRSRRHRGLSKSGAGGFCGASRFILPNGECMSGETKLPLSTGPKMEKYWAKEKTTCSALGGECYSTAYCPDGWRAISGGFARQNGSGEMAVSIDAMSYDRSSWIVRGQTLIPLKIKAWVLCMKDEIPYDIFEEGDEE